MCPTYNSNGFKMMIHSPISIPLVDQLGLAIGPGHLVVILNIDPYECSPFITASLRAQGPVL